MTLTIAPPDALERTYWVGTRGNCPIQHLTVAGVCLPRFTTRRQAVGLVDEPAGTIPGGIVHLSTEQHARLMRELERRVVRWQGAPNEFCRYGRRGDVLDVDEEVTRDVERVDPATGLRVVRVETTKLYRAMPQDFPILGRPAKDGKPAIKPAVFVKLVEKAADCPAFFTPDPTDEDADDEVPLEPVLAERDEDDEAATKPEADQGVRRVRPGRRGGLESIGASASV